MLDGGHMMFLAYEGIMRRPVNEAWELRLTLLGLSFLLCLMVFVIGLDIYRLSGMAG
jgi:regulator of sigma E protease